MKTILTALIMALPLYGLGQSNFSDKIDTYADVTPYQIRSKNQQKNKIAYSVTANYNIIRYLGLGMGVNSNAGYELVGTNSGNIRQTSIFLDLRPKVNIDRNQIFCFGNLGLSVIGDKVSDNSINWLEPSTELETDLYYVAEIGYSRNIFSRLGLQVNYKWKIFIIPTSQ